MEHILTTKNAYQYNDNFFKNSTQYLLKTALHCFHTLPQIQN